MPVEREALDRALAPVANPVKFARKSDQALSNLKGMGDYALKAAAAARALSLSAAESQLIDRLVKTARTFDGEGIEKRRALLTTLEKDLGTLAAGVAEPEAPAKKPRAETAALAEGDDLQRPVSSVKGVGPAIAQHLAVRGLKTLGDVLFFLPRRYEDRRKPTAIAQLKPGEIAVIHARIVDFRERFAYKRMYELEVADDSGTMIARWFGFRPGASKGFLPGTSVVISGEARENRRGNIEMIHPDMELGDAADDEASFGRIVPVYPEIDGVSARYFRRIALRVVTACSHSVVDFLPEDFRRQHDLADLAGALRAVHFPEPDSEMTELLRFASRPQRRLVFDELFFVQLGLALKKKGVQIELGIPMVADERIIGKALTRLPFQLTGAQRRALGEIAHDLEKSTPMNRLLQGDVGSGKTAVALSAALIAVENGYQAALMAPTELLAEQHMRTFERLLGGGLFDGKRGVEPVRTGLLSAGRKPKEFERTRNEFESGTVRIAVGTHALLEEGVKFQRLGLVIIDEQHRFGVLQRAKLMEKGARPHVLVMTATPIPRTLALTLYGDLDSSVIDELPPGRTPIVTKLFSGRTRPKAFDFVRKQVALGFQAYIVLPLVEESEKLDLRAASEEAERLKTAELTGLSIGLVHGRMSAEERNHAMELFRRGQTQVLVATTVIEVGVDVPNASVMLIDHAERFGLSQLHQLRGRVGRGAAKSYCLLVAEDDKSSADARERLGAMVRTSDGFLLAEKDLEIRGPGEFLGTKQSGMPDLVVADLLRDRKILSEARDAAFALVDSDGELKSDGNKSIAAELKRRWAGKMSLARIG